MGEQDYARLAFDLIDEFERLNEPDKVVQRMSAVLSRFGYGSFLISSAPDAVMGAPPVFLLDGWPPGWEEHYARENYYPDDPMAAHCHRTVDPFEWSEVRLDRERARRASEVMGAAGDFRLRAGFVVPIVRADGGVAAVTMAGERPDLDPRAKRAIHLIALYAHGKACTLKGADVCLKKRVLSAGEREVLNWTAAGKSSWEISVILSISEDTVNWRLKRASAKLGTVNRTHTVVNAIRNKEISI